jgi:hypothetical protein
VTFFVGAGLSIPSGLPGWTSFLLREGDRLGLDLRVRLGRGEYEEAAQNIAERIGAQSLYHSIRHTFGADPPTIPAGCAVSFLPYLSKGPTVTTNFDYVLEKAFEAARRPFQHVFAGAPAQPIVDAFDFNSNNLFKLHGSLTDPDQVILTLDQYRAHYGDKAVIDFERPLPASLELILIRRPLLILGCSLNRDRTLQIMERVAKRHPSIRRYAIVERPPTLQEFARKMAHLSKCGIQPLWYPTSCHAAVSMLISEMAWRTSPLAEQLASYAVEVQRACGAPQQDPATERHLYYDLRLRLRSEIGPSAQPSARLFTLNQAVQEFSKLMVLGDPGSGKTTALQHAARTAAMSFNASRLEPGWADRVALPLYVRLADFTYCSGSTPNDRIFSLLRVSFAHHKLILGEDDLQTILERYSLWLLLDGVSEIGDANISAFLAGMKDFLRRYSPRAVVFASRTQQYQANFPSGLGLPTLRLLDVMELSYPAGIASYVNEYVHDRSQTNQLMQEIRNRLPLRRLATNPLLLTLIIRIFQEHGCLPNSRGKLLEYTATALLARRGTEGRFSLGEKAILLGHVGFAMKSVGVRLTSTKAHELLAAAIHDEEDRSLWFPSQYDLLTTCSVHIKGTDIPLLLEDLKAQELLVGDSGFVAFWHQTIQEYFAAAHLLRDIMPLFSDVPLPQSLRSRLLARVKTYASDANWYEILAIASGIVTATDAEAAGRIQTRYIDAMWRYSRLLGAMCEANAEVTDASRPMMYAAQLGRRIDLMAIQLPRIYPWALLGLVLVMIWSIPTGRINSAAALVARFCRAPSPTVPYVLLAFAGLSGALSVLLFFRGYVWFLRTLETLANEHWIRPDILALRQLRTQGGATLARLLAKLTDEFSTGDNVRSTISSGRFLLERDEAELIDMLRSVDSRIQALDRLGDIGSVLSVGPIQDVIVSDVDNLTFSTAVRSLVQIIKGQPVDDPIRRDVETFLNVLCSGDGTAYPRRVVVHRALTDLGRVVPVPKRSLADLGSILRREIAVPVIALGLILMALLAVLRLSSS